MNILKNQKVLLAILPFSIYITMYFNRKSKNDASTILNNYEEILTKPIVLTLLALMTNIIGDYIKPEPPRFIINIFEGKDKGLVPRYIGFVLIVFLLTRDIELAFVTTVTFLIVLQLLREDDEKDKYPHLI